MALCTLALILLAFVVLLLVFQKVGANPPLIFILALSCCRRVVWCVSRRSHDVCTCMLRRAASCGNCAGITARIVRRWRDNSFCASSVRASLCWCELSDASCRGGLCSDFA